MSGRFMRMILFFDLPVESSSQQRAYRQFVKGLKKNGFIMMQKSVYIKLTLHMNQAKQEKLNIEKFVPSEGIVQIMIVTEKQFTEIEYLLGEGQKDVLDTEERMIIL